MSLKEFTKFRDTMNEKILKEGTLYTRRFFALDNDVYKDGKIPKKYKEMMGLIASIVLRCDDCITYHIIQCIENGITKEEFFEIIDIALIVGGSITIPHIRKATKIYFELLNEYSQKQQSS
ncbi:MAG: carboxymuconolactone decarboxylase family protein [candidate division WOR-3 bacterium]|nr:carboxymuconolactone decarboxylase family protein [candidate division WOR-3 bacterium]MCX7948339.1 carboxymuconolactone decarboxylase family protein [candidate division WOR-3 bacterium]MDW8150833.1 carboxymuconolactone decarboxylase family protein [candidate division WOR-3 bacterium]